MNSFLRTPILLLILAIIPFTTHAGEVKKASYSKNDATNKPLDSFERFKKISCNNYYLKSKNYKVDCFKSFNLDGFFEKLEKEKESCQKTCEKEKNDCDILNCKENCNQDESSAKFNGELYKEFNFDELDEELTKEKIKKIVPWYCRNFEKHFYKDFDPKNKNYKMPNKKLKTKAWDPCLESKNDQDLEKLVLKDFDICMENCKALNATDASDKRISCEDKTCEIQCQGRKKGGLDGLNIIRDGLNALQ